ncbi:MAG: amino acid synthesis family protein [Burkholderiaceae bacterium]
MKLSIRRWLTHVEHKLVEAGQTHAEPLRKVAVAAVIENPFGDGYRADLSAGIAASEQLGEQLAQQLLSAFGPYPVQSYGKAGIVGTAGEQEHANALLTTTFADPLRKAVGGGKAWISSMTKVGGPGTLIDIPLASKDALYVRSHYDGLSLCLAGAPLPDEIAIIFAVANRGRLNARVGGLALADAVGRDGLV